MSQKNVFIVQQKIALILIHGSLNKRLYKHDVEEKETARKEQPFSYN